MRKSIDNPLIEFKISSESNGSYEIIKLREDLDVDHDELDAILKECVLKITEALQNGEDLSAINLDATPRPYAILNR